MENQAYALALLKYRLDELEKKVTGIDDKLDELLALRSKGMGAFWLGSLLFGTSIIGFLTAMISWMKG